MKMRIFYFELYMHKITKELEAINYNNFLAISSTVIKKDASFDTVLSRYSVFFHIRLC